MDSDTVSSQFRQLYDNIMREVEKHDVLRHQSDYLQLQMILISEISCTNISLQDMIENSTKTDEVNVTEDSAGSKRVGSECTSTGKTESMEVGNESDQVQLPETVDDQQELEMDIQAVVEIATESDELSASLADGECKEASNNDIGFDIFIPRHSMIESTPIRETVPVKRKLQYDDPYKKRYRSKSVSIVLADCSSSTDVPVQHSIKKARTIQHRRKTSVASKAELKHYDDTPKKLNIDPEMHIKNILYSKLCVLCDKRMKNLVPHYVKEHTDHENLIARPSPSAATRLRSQVERFEKIGQKIIGLCFICDEVKSMAKSSWSRHYLTHTGEFMYYCSLCSYKAQNKAAHGCAANSLVGIYEDNATDGSLTAFMCKECNYLQISCKKMISHMKTEHKYHGAIAGNHFDTVTLVPDLSTASTNVRSN